MGLVFGGQLAESSCVLCADFWVGNGCALQLETVEIGV